MQLIYYSFLVMSDFLNALALSDALALNAWALHCQIFLNAF